MEIMAAMLIPLVPVLIGYLAHRSYRGKSDAERQQILADPRFLNRYVRRPLLALGARWEGIDEPPPSILPPRPYLKHQALLPAGEPQALPEGTFSIQSTSTPHRCEICHQDDLFDAPTGHCRRCGHQTR